MKLLPKWNRFQKRRKNGSLTMPQKSIGLSCISKANAMASNSAESLNSWILEARELPILPMFETIRHQLMDWFAERSQLETHTMGLLVKDASNRIQTMVNTRTRRYHIWTVDQVEYEIQSHNGEAIHEYLVNLVDCTCTCHAFQALGIPCAHALACIIYRKEEPQMYAASFYHLDSF